MHPNLTAVCETFLFLRTKTLNCTSFFVTLFLLFYDRIFLSFDKERKTPSRSSSVPQVMSDVGSLLASTVILSVVRLKSLLSSSHFTDSHVWVQLSIIAHSYAVRFCRVHCSVRLYRLNRTCGQALVRRCLVSAFCT